MAESIQLISSPVIIDVDYTQNPIVISTTAALINAPANIGGIPISIANPSPYDVLALNANANTWINNPQKEITDGGNF